MGNVTQVGTTDSVYVEGDTLIGANTYKKIKTFVRPGNVYSWTTPLALIRDSAGYLVNERGVFIEHTNFTDTLAYSDMGPGVVNAWYFMRHADSSVTVPAGTFLTIDYEGHMYATDTNYWHPVPRYTHRLFADGVGMITEILYYYTQPGYVQRRLISYHIQ